MVPSFPQAVYIYTTPHMHSQLALLWGKQHATAAFASLDGQPPRMELTQSVAGATDYGVSVSALGKQLWLFLPGGPR